MLNIFIYKQVVRLHDPSFYILRTNFYKFQQDKRQFHNYIKKYVRIIL